MLDTQTKTDMASLVLTVGSCAGREAPLQYGYYMIGRHRECQIRPKSRSVSRRHCLLYQDDTGLQVLDLTSTSGTRVNDLRILPMTWTLLRDGDVLRCGKVAFRVNLGHPSSENHESSPVSSKGDPPDSMPVGKAWHDVDIAGFLETEDDADRERRYDDIRSNQQPDLESSDEFSDDLQTTVEMEVDLDLFDDAFNDPMPSEAVLADRRDPGVKADRDTQCGATPAKSKLSRKEKKSQGPSKLVLPKLRRRSSVRTFSFGMPADADHWKLIGVVLLMLAVLGAVGYSAYTFYSGPSVRVLKSID